MISMMVLAASLLVASHSVAQPTGNVTFGSQWWNQSVDEAKLQEFLVLPKGGFLDSYYLRDSRGSVNASMWGTRALEDDQRHGLSVSKGLQWRVDAEFNGTPHLYSMTARSPLYQISPGVFVLPDSVQRLLQQYAPVTGNAYANTLRDLLNTAQSTPLAMQTNVQKLRLRAHTGKEWQFDVSAVRRDRQGSLAFGVPFGIGSSTMTEVAAPIDQRMVDADATGVWSRAGMKLMGSVGLSTFENEVSTMRVDNSRRLTDATSGGTAVGQLDMWPDNKVMRGRVAFSKQLPRMSTFTATVGVSQAKQDDDFLPFTSNTALAQSNLDSLPARNVEAVVTTIVQDYRLTGRPMNKMYGTLRYRAEHNENETPTIHFKGFSPYDASFSVGAVENHQWGGSSTILGADVDYELADWADLSLLGEHRTRTHEFREVEEDAENVFGAGLRLRPLDAVDITGNYRVGQRRLDSFIAEDYLNAAGLQLEPKGLRRYDVADRDQSMANAAVNWVVSPKLDLSVTYSWTQDDYKESQYGLQNADNMLVFVEGTIHASKTLDLTGGYGFGQVETKMASNEYSASSRPDTLQNSMDWWIDTQDRNVYVFANADWWVKPNKMVLKADYTFSRSMNKYDFSNQTLLANGTRRAEAVDVPNTFYRSNDVTFEARWKWSAMMDLALQFQYVQFDVDDFAVNDLTLLGGSFSGANFAPNAIYLGDGYRDFTARRVAVMASRKF
ncbi:MAG: MtrB/PioB family outer membrane beta-barrel protein [Candidatus Eisenbacteria bacterium]|nr:MtrB/PioB family outer membrane beta-barrel protein [Candidatus Eisenbacteria bacterium]